VPVSSARREATAEHHRRPVPRPSSRLPGQLSVMLSGADPSGKGVGVVIPNLLNWPDSVVVLDIKGENYDITAGFRAKHGQAVYAFSPFDEEGRSHRWNPLTAVRRARITASATC
jgi:type IV secretion system protein VirD4